jgi:hypothetical protein
MSCDTLCIFKQNIHARPTTWIGRPRPRDGPLLGQPMLLVTPRAPEALPALPARLTSARPRQDARRVVEVARPAAFAPGLGHARPAHAGRVRLTSRARFRRRHPLGRRLPLRRYRRSNGRRQQEDGLSWQEHAPELCYV